jgi:phage gpG-like protein
MAKVRIKNTDRIKQSVKEELTKIISDKRLLTDIGVKMLELTQSFNRAGKSPTGKKHEAISDDWIETKEELRPYNKVSEYYRKGASNLTFTGQLIRSIKFRVESSKATVVIEPTGKHLGYNLKNNKKTKSISNAKLTEYLKDQGRILLGFNKQIENNLNRVVRVFVNKQIRSRFKLR